VYCGLFWQVLKSHDLSQVHHQVCTISQCSLTTFIVGLSMEISSWIRFEQIWCCLAKLLTYTHPRICNHYGLQWATGGQECGGWAVDGSWFSYPTSIRCHLNGKGYFILAQHQRRSGGLSSLSYPFAQRWRRVTLTSTWLPINAQLPMAILRTGRGSCNKRKTDRKT